MYRDTASYHRAGFPSQLLRLPLSGCFHAFVTLQEQLGEKRRCAECGVHNRKGNKAWFQVAPEDIRDSKRSAALRTGCFCCQACYQRRTRNEAKASTTAQASSSNTPDVVVSDFPKAMARVWSRWKVESAVVRYFSKRTSCNGWIGSASRTRKTLFRNRTCHDWRRTCSTTSPPPPRTTYGWL